MRASRCRGCGLEGGLPSAYVLRHVPPPPQSLPAAPPTSPVPPSPSASSSLPPRATRRSASRSAPLDPPARRSPTSTDPLRSTGPTLIHELGPPRPSALALVGAPRTPWTYGSGARGRPSDRSTQRIQDDDIRTIDMVTRGSDLQDRVVARLGVKVERLADHGSIPRSPKRASQCSCVPASPYSRWPPNLLTASNRGTVRA